MLRGKGRDSRPHQQMEVVAEGPSVESEGLCLDEPGEAADEVVPVLVIPEEDLPIQPAPHHGGRPAHRDAQCGA